MVRRRLQKSAYRQKKWPLTPEELVEMLDRGLLQNFYNAIYYTMHDFAKKNESGYAETRSHTTDINQNSFVQRNGSEIVDVSPT